MNSLDSGGKDKASVFILLFIIHYICNTTSLYSVVPHLASWYIRMWILSLFGWHSGTCELAEFSWYIHTW